MEFYRIDYKDKQAVIDNLQHEIENFYQNFYPSIKHKKNNEKTIYMHLIFMVDVMLKLIKHEKADYSVSKLIKTIIYSEKILDPSKFLLYLLLHGNITFKEKRKIAYFIYKKNKNPEILQCLTPSMLTSELYEKLSSELLMTKLNNN